MKFRPPKIDPTKKPKKQPFLRKIHVKIPKSQQMEFEKKPDV